MRVARIAVDIRSLNSRAAPPFQRHKIYDVEYAAKDPTLVGLGPAAVRDAVSRLKNGGAEELGIPDGTI